MDLLGTHCKRSQIAACAHATSTDYATACSGIHSDAPRRESFQTFQILHDLESGITPRQTKEQRRLGPGRRRLGSPTERRLWIRLTDGRSSFNLLWSRHLMRSYTSQGTVWAWGKLKHKDMDCLNGMVQAIPLKVHDFTTRAPWQCQNSTFSFVRPFQCFWVAGAVLFAVHVSSSPFAVRRRADWRIKWVPGRLDNTSTGTWHAASGRVKRALRIWPPSP